MTNSQPWTIRRALAADQSQLRDLFRSVFGFDRGAANYEWKFNENPDGKAVIAVAENSDGALVGQYALWPTKLRLGSSVVNGAQSLDTMTHPDYRGQGMFTRLAEKCMSYAEDEGIEVLYGFPNDNSYPGFVRKLDWDHTGDVPLWVRLLRPSRHRRVPKWAGAIVDLGAALLPTGKIDGLHVDEAIPQRMALENLIEVHFMDHKNRCSVSRDYDRLLWRFSSRSGMQYRWFSVYNVEELVSVSVVGIDIRNGNAQLAEVIGKDAQVIQAAIASAVQGAAALNCPVLLAVSSRADCAGALRRAGFFRRPGIPLIVRKLTTRTLGANVHSHEHWNIFGADLDTF